MNGTTLKLFATVVIAMSLSACGHYLAPIRSSADINRQSALEHMIVVVTLPLQDWPKLGKFSELQHFRVAEEMGSDITDDHIKALSQLQLPKLRQVSLAHCGNVTDKGLEALADIPSIEGLQLVGVGITDRGLDTLATRFPRLKAINVGGCGKLTTAGFLALTKSSTLTS